MKSLAVSGADPDRQRGLLYCKMESRLGSWDSLAPEGRPSLSPETPPRYCPTCGQDLSEFPYYQKTPGTAAKIVRRIALGLLPAMALAYLGFLIWGTTSPGFGTGAGYFAVGVIGGPSLLLYAVSRLLPHLRDVICLRCSWNQEFPFER